MHVSNLDLKELQYRMQQEDEEGYEERQVQPHDEESHWAPPAEGDDNFKVLEELQAAPAHQSTEAVQQHHPLVASTCTIPAVGAADSILTDGLGSVEL
jgi:hypothetical protein